MATPISPAVAFPPAFEYSQTNLQDFTACARRFQLRYVLNQPWPAPIAEPLMQQERDSEAGIAFHRMAQRYYLGVPPTEQTAYREPFAAWISAFLDHQPDLPLERRPEVTVNATIAGKRFVAAFDLLAYGAAQDRVLIVDWKTSAHKPSRALLENRWQTILYPTMLVACAPRLLGFPVQPEAIQMMYWFTAQPGQPEVFAYDQDRYAGALRRIADHVGTIEALVQAQNPVWPLTDDLRQCKLCNYRSLCARGVQAASAAEWEATESADAGDQQTQSDIPNIQPRDEYVL